MRDTGVVRKVGNLGRIVIPKELRKAYGLDVGTDIEIYTEDDKIILKKLQSACIFCHGSDELHDFENYKICEKCIQKIARK